MSPLSDGWSVLGGPSTEERGPDSRPAWWSAGQFACQFAGDANGGCFVGQGLVAAQQSGDERRAAQFSLGRADQDVGMGTDIGRSG
jgi:hypothetical protein